MDELTDEVRTLQRQARELAQLVDGKVKFIQQTVGPLNPVAVLQQRIEFIFEYIIPRHTDQERIGEDVPTNVERLLFDIAWHKTMIQMLDQSVGLNTDNGTRGLHVIGGGEDG